MATFWNQPPQPVRPRSSGRVPVFLCLLVCGLTAIVVYRWGSQWWRPVRTEPTYTATAYTVERPESGGENRIPFACSADNPRHAEATANALADRHVADRRAQWQAETKGPRLTARQAAEKARRDYDRIASQRAAIMRQLHDEVEAAANAKVEPALEAALPPVIVNPRWSEIQQKLTQLQRSRSQLLADRTPLHPAVQEIDVRIADAEEQLAAVPKLVPDAAARNALTAGASPSAVDRAAGPAASSVAAEDEQKLNGLNAALRRARRVCNDAELTEQQAAQRQQAGPQLTVQPAQAVQDPLVVDYGWRRLLGSALAAGVLMAFGIGMVSFGAGVEPAVATAAEVEAVLGSPIIGTMPAHDPAADPTEPQHQTRLRRAAIAIGLVLVAACPLAAIWGIVGM
jgi:hypothetical protein